MEMDSPQGAWRLEGVNSAVLDMVGWQVRIVDSRVNVTATVPRLEMLVLEIVNTSPGESLTVQQGEVTISGVVDEVEVVGPSREAALARNDSLRVVYNPGIRAPLLLYPFAVRIIADRPGGVMKQVVLKLY